MERCNMPQKLAMLPVDCDALQLKCTKSYMPASSASGSHQAAAVPPPRLIAAMSACGSLLVCETKRRPRFPQAQAQTQAVGGREGRETGLVGRLFVESAVLQVFRHTNVLWEAGGGGRASSDQSGS